MNWTGGGGLAEEEVAEEEVAEEEDSSDATRVVVADVVARKQLKARWKMDVQQPSAASECTLSLPVQYVSTIDKRGSLILANRAGTEIAMVVFKNIER